MASREPDHVPGLGKLLFMHWPVSEELLRPLLPSRLRIDTFNGTAWIGVTPFTMPRLRPALLPTLPVVGTSHEINVRTYVHCEGVPGVWFLSLDASNPLAVLGARLGFALPYFLARITLEEQDRTIQFTSRRTHRELPRLRLRLRGATKRPCRRRWSS